MITRRTEVTERTLEREGYRIIATRGLNTQKTMDIHIKIGSEGRQQEKQTLVGLEKLATGTTRSEKALTGKHTLRRLPEHHDHRTKHQQKRES